MVQLRDQMMGEHVDTIPAWLMGWRVRSMLSLSRSAVECIAMTLNYTWTDCNRWHSQLLAQSYICRQRPDYTKFWRVLRNARAGSACQSEE